MTLSVCMAVYNGSKFIVPQLSSILTQLDRDDEVVIVDDASQDNTRDIISREREPRIKLYSNVYNQGVVRTFEKALSLARGDIICLADQDDVWSENKITQTMKFLSRYDLVVSDCSIIDETGEEVEPSFYAIRKSGRGIIKNIYKNSYLGCCMAFRRWILKHALPFPDAIPMHDMWLGIIAEIYGTTFFCKDKLVQYRRHAGNASPTNRQSSYSLTDKLRFRFNLISTIAGRVCAGKSK